MSAKQLVVKAITEALESYAAYPGDAYLGGRVSGLISAATLFGAISDEECDRLSARNYQIGRTYSRKLEQEAGA